MGLVHRATTRTGLRLDGEVTFLPFPVAGHRSQPIRALVRRGKLCEGAGVHGADGCPCDDGPRVRQERVLAQGLQHADLVRALRPAAGENQRSFEGGGRGRRGRVK